MSSKTIASKGGSGNKYDSVDISKIPIDEIETVPEYNLAKGPVRSYYISDPLTDDLVKTRTLVSLKEKILVVSLLIFACSVRLYRLEWPESVVFDEVHFGKFAAYYIKRHFFFDVHPPFAKMLFALIGHLAGFTGEFEFDNIAIDFPSDVPYYTMRLFPALCGVVTVMLMYFTLRLSGVKIWISLLASLILAIENSFVTISRYILLDSPLIMFIASSLYFYKKSEIYKPYSKWNIMNLVFCGLSLGFASSSKWVGLFTVAYIGVLSILKIWVDLGDLSKSYFTITRNSALKLVTLLVLPTILYVIIFAVHMNRLNVYNEAASFLSPQFKASLEGNNVPKNITSNVGVGSVVSLYHMGTSGYLHSHEAFYPEGSHQQQVSVYNFIDPNNNWIIELYDEPNVEVTSFQNLTDRTKIRLKHYATRARLHSHDVKAPVSTYSDWQKEVSAYGDENFDGDPNDDWIIEIDKDLSKPGVAQEIVVAIDTKFRLRHAMTGCLLFSHKTKYPEWGSEQLEVTCAGQGIDALTVWYIESNLNPVLEDDEIEIVNYPVIGFWGKFIEYHVNMWEINRDLSAPHPYESYPAQWPLLHRGLGYWHSHNRQVYMLGNAIIWWSVSIFIALFFLECVTQLVNWQLDGKKLQDPVLINFHISVFEYLLGYFLHFIPSFLMKRQLFLHHYLPAYYFGILAFAHALDIVVSYILRNKRNTGYIIIVAFFAICHQFYKSHSPIIYGTKWTQELCLKSQWLPFWDYPCPIYLETLEAYDNYTFTKNYVKKVDPSGELPLENYPEGQNQNNRRMEQKFDPSGNSWDGAEDMNPVADDEIEALLNNGQQKKFVDQNGNTLGPDEVRRLLKEGGASIVGSKQEMVPNSATASMADPEEFMREIREENRKRKPRQAKKPQTQEVEEDENEYDESDEIDEIFEEDYDEEYDDYDDDEVDTSVEYQKKKMTTSTMNAKQQKIVKQRVKELDQIMKNNGDVSFLDQDGNPLDPASVREMMLSDSGRIVSFDKVLGSAPRSSYNIRSDPEVKKRLQEFDEMLKSNGGNHQFIGPDGKQLKPEEVRRYIKQNGAHLQSSSVTTLYDQTT